MNKVVFIGPYGGGKVPTNGASIKNYHIIKVLQSMGIKATLIDTEKWRRNPLILLRVLWYSIVWRKAKFIVSTSNQSAYYLLSILTLFPSKRDVVYWVIGGNVANWIKEGRLRAKPFMAASHILCEGDSMKTVFGEMGISNVITVPNFKHITYQPRRNSARSQELRFVFLSRVDESKGCDVIFQAVKCLNNDGMKSRFNVTFYGPIADTYKAKFYRQIEEIENVTYGGFIDLRDVKNYDYLVNYDVMLFPTFWYNEGFPGVLIDAFIAGLPIIASDWNLNKDLVQDGITGLVIPPKDANSLSSAMKYLIENRQVVEDMSLLCAAKAMEYDTNHVLTQELFDKVGIKN